MSLFSKKLRQLPCRTLKLIEEFCWAALSGLDKGGVPKMQLNLVGDWGMENVRCVSERGSVDSSFK